MSLYDKYHALLEIDIVSADSIDIGALREALLNTAAKFGNASVRLVVSESPKRKYTDTGSADTFDSFPVRNEPRQMGFDVTETFGSALSEPKLEPRQVSVVDISDGYEAVESRPAPMLPDHKVTTIARQEFSSWGGWASGSSDYSSGGKSTYVSPRAHGLPLFESGPWSLQWEWPQQGEKLLACTLSVQHKLGVTELETMTDIVPLDTPNKTLGKLSKTLFDKLKLVDPYDDLIALDVFTQWTKAVSSPF